MSAGPSVAEKVERYEEVLNESLKADLQRTLDERDKLFERISQWCMRLKLSVLPLPSQPCPHQPCPHQPRPRLTPPGRSLELRNNMSLIKEHELRSLKTQISLGCDFYVQAKMCVPASFAHTRANTASSPAR